MADSLIDFGQIAQLGQQQIRNNIDILQTRQRDEQLKLSREAGERQDIARLINLWGDDRVRNNPQLDDAMAGEIGKKLGLIDLTPETNRNSREVRKQLFVSVFNGDRDKANDAMAQLMVQGTMQDAERIASTMKQFDSTRGEYEDRLAHRQLNQAKYELLQDKLSQVSQGSPLYTKAAQEFSAALTNTGTPKFTKVLDRIAALSPKEQANASSIATLIGGKDIAHLAGPSVKNLQAHANEQAAQYLGMAQESQEALDMLNRGGKLPDNLTKGDLLARISVGRELSNAYSTLGEWADDPFNKEKFKAVQAASTAVEAQRKNMEKLRVSNQNDSMTLAQDALSFRKTEAGQKHATEAAFATATQRYLALPTNQQTQQNASRIATEVQNESGVPVNAQALFKNPNSPQSVTNVNLAQETAFSQEIGKGLAKDVLDTKVKARDAVEIIDTIHQGLKLLDSGVITGVGAEYLTKFGQALSDMGFSESDDKIANTRAFSAVIANNVGKLIKQFGSGTGLSDEDRKFAIQMAGGDITIGERSIRNILRIGEEASRNIIARHNESVKGVKSIIPLTIEAPAAYVPSKTGGQPKAQPQSGKQAQPQSGGATLEALPKGSKQIGTSGGKPVYETPDGKRWAGE